MEQIVGENEAEQELSTSDELCDKLINLEQFALSMEEHAHAQTLFQRNKNGKPLGHRW